MRPSAAAGVLMCLASALGQAAPDDWRPEQRLERIEGDLRQSFDAELAAFDTVLQSRPFDVGLHVDRCRFIELFSYTYEYVAWIDEIYERSTACVQTLEQRFSDHPEVELKRLEDNYDDGAVLEAGEALLANSPPGWTGGQRARLYALLATATDRLGRDDTSEYALNALALDARADVRLIAAASLIARSETEQAVEILTSPLEGHSSEDGWYLTRKMQMLADIGASEHVASLYGDLVAYSQYHDSLSVARALRDSGAIDLARAEFERATGDYLTSVEFERFKFEFAFGTSEQALAAYGQWRDLGWGMDPLGINRVALFLRDASLPWRARDWLSLAGIALALAVIALAALLPVGLVHYRALARRERLGAALPEQGWQLKHAWVAIFAFGTASLASYYLSGGPLGFGLGNDAVLGMDASSAQIAQVTVVESLLGILLLLPLAWAASRRSPAWWGAQWSLTKSVLIGLAAGLALRLPLLLVWLGAPEIEGLFSESLIFQILIEVRERFGVFSAFWVVVLAAPVAEEFLFRGILLRAFANNLSFRWANVGQAALFSAGHLDLAAAPLLFAFGLVAGLIARRSGGLLGAMVMHCVFNAIAAVMFLL